jgi:hypothetical protein
MWKKIWRNRLEFYPACALFIWYTVGCALSSLRVQNRPGIGTLGLITLPSVAVYFVGVVRTYRGLTSERGRA